MIDDFDDHIREARAIQRRGDALLEKMQASDRVRAQKRLEREGLAALDDYSRKLLALPTREQEAREQEEADREAELVRQRADREQAARREAIAALLRPKDLVFRNEFLARLNAHAIDLVAKHNLKVRIQHDGNGSASPETRTISVPPVTDPVTYVTVLHEIAHIIEPTADSRQFRHVIKGGGRLAPDAEIGAWRFTCENAVSWTREMFDDMHKSLGSYGSEATPEELERIVAFVKSAALNISDRPLTFEQLDALCDRLMGARPSPALQGRKSAAHESSPTDLGPQLAVAHAEIERLKGRLDRVEALPVPIYRGVWAATEEYTAGSFVTKNGSVWHANRITRAMPGTSADWTLAVKHGRDGR